MVVLQTQKSIAEKFDREVKSLVIITNRFQRKMLLVLSGSWNRAENYVKFRPNDAIIVICRTQL